MHPRVAIFGGSFNPPGTHHRAVAEALVQHFDRIIVIPCGPRPDKPATNDVDPWHRATLTDITFRGIPKVEVDLFDLELASFTTNDIFESRYRHLGELWHVVGSDLVLGGGKEQSAIHRYWQGAREMWQNLNFCVIRRDGYDLEPGDMPPKSQLMELPQGHYRASDEIREMIFRREPYASLVTRDVAAYIERYGLYRGRIPSRRTRWTAEEPRLLICLDERNVQAVELAKSYRRWAVEDDPTAILVLGGDGTMLRAIREHWRTRAPFIGVNQGHLGFLLNEADTVPADRLLEEEFVIRLMPMLYVEVEDENGAVQNDLAFNDAWIERSTSQSAWLRVEVNDEVRIPKLVADGALVCTAAGSTAYARSMGVSPLLVDTPGWILVGSNVMSPTGWKSALLAPETTITVRSLGGEKRPLSAFVGGKPLGPAVRFHARLSRIATVELIFSARRDMAEKISLLQFPSGGALL
jgi:NAD kinase